MPLEIVLDSLILSSVYIMMALGLVLVFSIMGLLNFAHGQFYMIGAFLLYFSMQTLGCNYFLSLAIAAMVVGLLGIGVERFIMRPIAQPYQVIVATIALIPFFEGLMVLFFGPRSRSVPTPFPGNTMIGDIAVSNERLVSVLISILLIVGLYLFVQKTKLGLALRASAQQPVAAGLFGIKTARVSMIVMGMGCGLAALAGGVMAPMYYVDAWMGTQPLTMAMLAIVIGGMGSLGGAVIGGLILGIIDSVIAFYVGFWAQLLSLGVVILVLLIRPQGLFGIAEK